MNTKQQTRSKQIKSTPLTIGHLGRKAGVNVETIRYYQRIGLIEEPIRPYSGFRTYATSSVDRIKFIKRAQKLGFSLTEISELLELGDGRCADVRQRAETKRAQIQDQIQALMALDKTLNKLVIACRTELSPTCPIIATLATNQ